MSALVGNLSSSMVTRAENRRVHTSVIRKKALSLYQEISTEPFQCLHHRSVTDTQSEKKPTSMETTSNLPPEIDVASATRIMVKMSGDATDSPIIHVTPIAPIKKTIAVNQVIVAVGGFDPEIRSPAIVARFSVTHNGHSAMAIPISAYVISTKNLSCIVSFAVNIRCF